MAEREWKPGDVAKLTTPSGREHVALRVGWPNDDWISATEGGVYGATEIRPLVLIDPESVVFEGESDDDENRIPEIVNCLRRIAEGDGGRTWRARLCLRLADEFERQARPPKPSEPTGLGAVVVDRDGSMLIRVNNEAFPWRATGGHRFSWDQVDHLTTLSEGAEPMADWEIDLLRGES